MKDFQFVANPEVVFLSKEKDEETLVGLISEYFSKSKEEIRKAVLGEQFEGYDYRNRIILGIRSEDGLAAGCILVSKKVNQHRVFEVVWLAANPLATKKGVGSTLFAGVLELAKKKGISAVLVTSTNRAVSWWISRKNCNLCRFILRGSSRGKLDRIELSPNEADNERNANILKNMYETKKIVEQPFPTHSMFETLYSEKINRNRKGKPATVQTFRGTSYRYDIEQSNHIWFLVAPSLSKHLGCKA